MAWLVSCSCYRFKVYGLCSLSLAYSWRTVLYPCDKIFLDDLFQVGHPAHCFTKTKLLLVPCLWLLYVFHLITVFYSVSHKHSSVIQFLMVPYYTFKTEGKHGHQQNESNLQNLASNSLSLLDMSQWNSPGSNHASKPLALYSNQYLLLHFYIYSQYIFLMCFLAFFWKPYLVMNSTRAMTFAFFKISSNRHKHNPGFGGSNPTIY